MERKKRKRAIARPFARQKIAVMYTTVFVHETDPSECEPLESVDFIGIDCVLKNTRNHRAEASDIPLHSCLALQ
jgi:hypothetical protein